MSGRRKTLYTYIAITDRGRKHLSIRHKQEGMQFMMGVMTWQGGLDRAGCELRRGGQVAGGAMDKTIEWRRGAKKA